MIVMVHIPSHEGYYRERFEILKICLGSILAHTDRPYDLFVIDNGSRPDVVAYLNGLREKNLVQHLFLNSQNLGHGHAINMAFAAAQGEYIAFTNDDVLFHPHWLSEHLRVFQTFPKVGVVSGQVVLGDVLHDSVEKVAKAENIDHRLFDVPFEWTKLWCEELGADPDRYLEQSTVRSCRNFLLEKDGLKAYSGANGYAAVFRADVLRRVPPIKVTLSLGGEDIYFHRAIDEVGYMRLCTYEKLTDHIGNSVNERLRLKIEKYGLSAGGGIGRKDGRKSVLIDNRFSQRVFRAAFRRLLPLIRN